MAQFFAQRWMKKAEKFHHLPMKKSLVEKKDFNKKT
jgi:hypothetical protein